MKIWGFVSAAAMIVCATSNARADDDGASRNPTPSPFYLAFPGSAEVQKLPDPAPAVEDDVDARQTSRKRVNTAARPTKPTRSTPIAKLKLKINHHEGAMLATGAPHHDDAHDTHDVPDDPAPSVAPEPPQARSAGAFDGSHRVNETEKADTVTYQTAQIWWGATEEVAERLRVFGTLEGLSPALKLRSVLDLQASGALQHLSQEPI